MADMTTIKGKIRDTIYPNGKGAITAEKHQSLLLDVVDNINELKQDTLVSGQNIRSLVSGEPLLGSGALGVLGTKFIYELDSQQLFAIIDGAQQDFHIWMASRAVHSQVAQVIEIRKEGYFKELVPLTIKNKAGIAALCWEYDGMIYEASMEDNVLTVVSKPKGDEFDKAGNYPLLHVGTADDLAGRGESVPASFGFRASGGKSIKDGRAYIKRIKGNSVVWNQSYPTDWTRVGNGVTSISSNSVIVSQGTLGETNTYFPLEEFKNNVENAVYLFTCEILEGASQLPSTAEFALFNRSGFSKFTNGFAWLVVKNTTPSNGKSIGIRFLTAGQEINLKWRICQHNLTQMFGAEEAAKITTIEDFNARKPIVEDEYVYNEGEVIHMNTESIKSVGDNAWDEEWENGTFNTTTGANIDNSQIRSKNLIKVLPDTEYHVTIPSFLGNDGMWVLFYDQQGELIEGYKGGDGAIVNNAYLVRANSGFLYTAKNAWYIKFYMPSSYGTTYNHDIMISLVHSGWKQDTDAGYQPYWQDTLPLPIIRKYFPDGMMKAGSAHDEIRYNKATQKWEYTKSKTGGGRIKGVDMGSLEWEVVSYNGVPAFRSFGVTNAVEHNADKLGNSITALYSQKTKFANLTEDENKVYVLNSVAHTPNTLAIRDNSYTDAASFKAAMQGVMLYYEAADWEWVELDAEDQNFRDYYQVADFGTEEAIPATDAEGNIIPSAPFSADIIYQFNAVDMIREHELEINELQSIIATMQAQLTSLTNGGQ